ncbi:helicase-related protein [Bacillus taeanensis]|uniref:RNA helicase n=1 Tax=Bacillus taeanensis TaxID=273032 RepID=A0A366XU51_9BACI|nr:helicase-related protein [Bacillus taeanensis]RBW69186.1 RNA helicase [Bacillus taeanensis]
MAAITELYPRAVEHTKKKIYEDINHYLEDKEELPSFEDYLADRGHYTEQLWINVWLTKVTNAVSKQEKKRYLSKKGYEVDGIDKKIINKVFRNEMRTYQPFDVTSWLHQKISDREEEWQVRYQNARSHFLNREKEQKIKENRTKVLTAIENAVEEIIDDHEELFYLYVRHYAAQQLANDFKSKPKYRRIDPVKIEEMLVEEGSFHASDYDEVSEFFSELTGAVHKVDSQHIYAYETYYEAYEKLIENYLSEQLPKLIIEHLPEAFFHDYEETFHEKLTDLSVDDLILYNLQSDYFEKIELENLSDLLNLSNVPFDVSVHKEIYEKDFAEKIRKKEEELAELKRKREEEARMIEDIFGREYSPSFDRNKRYVLHIGETNTGKTYHALERMKEAQSGLYLAPLRLLALEVFDKLTSENIHCALKTGEEEKNIEGASHFSCTVEMFHEKDFYDVIVIDEAQMITDKDRGFSWYKAITKANAHEVHIIASTNAKKMILQLLGDSQIEINEYKRDIPLEVESKFFQIKHTKKADALVCFSRRRVLETAAKLQSDGHAVSMIYGSMPPETRKKQMQQFMDGKTTVIVSTDAIGMGLNLPIRRIVFLETDKFDGTRRRRLTSQEVKQIAGRAGRKGLYNVGKVAFTKDIRVMKRLLEQQDELVQTFAIAPTNSVFERFQRYYRDLGTFFALWEKFESPPGTKKASLSEERELYKVIRNTEIEARFSMMDLYGFLHLPFSKKEPSLTKQWEETMWAIIERKELPEPKIKKGNLEELELSYKALGLHLLFLYRLERQTEAAYWERLRDQISTSVHEQLKTDIKNYTKKCKHCSKTLSWDYPYSMCNTCHSKRYKRQFYDIYEEDWSF